MLGLSSHPPALHSESVLPLPGAAEAGVTEVMCPTVSAGSKAEVPGE